MDLYPSELEEEVRAAGADYLHDNMPLADARIRPVRQWREMAEMGWFAIALPPEAGGAGMTHGIEALLFAELGRHLAPIGVIAAAIAAKLAHQAGDNALVAEIAKGARLVGLGIGSGDQLRVLAAAGAEMFTLATPDAAAIYAREDAGWDPKPCLDLSTSQVLISRPAAIWIRGGSDAAQHQMLATAAFALGAAEAARDMATEYAKLREQFSRPIGSFQAIKHICADMAVRCAAARAQLLYAALSFDDAAPDAALQIAIAKRLADTAAVENGRSNVQVHGGMGMTDESDVHLVLKRAHLLKLVSPVDAAMLLN